MKWFHEDEAFPVEWYTASLEDKADRILKREPYDATKTVEQNHATMIKTNMVCRSYHVSLLSFMRCFAFTQNSGLIRCIFVVSPLLNVLCSVLHLIFWHRRHRDELLYRYYQYKEHLNEYRSYLLFAFHRKSFVLFHFLTID